MKKFINYILRLFNLDNLLHRGKPTEKVLPLTEEMVHVQDKAPEPQITIKMPVIDKVFFYQSIRDEKLFKILSQKQVEVIDNILIEWTIKGYSDLRWLAYMFATVYHETAATMLPIEEYGRGKGKPYGKMIDVNGKKYTYPNKLYYGRGLVQLTWRSVYEKMGKLLNINLLENPDLALDLKVAVSIMFEGMLKGDSHFGDFTGVSLENYFNNSREDWISARKIINGTDKAELISSYGKKFLKCLKWSDSGDRTLSS